MSTEFINHATEDAVKELPYADAHYRNKVVFARLESYRYDFSIFGLEID